MKQFEHVSIEDIFPAECELYGYRLVGVAYDICRREAIKDQLTVGETHDLVIESMNNPELRQSFQEKLDSSPDDYDPWHREVMRRRGLRAKGLI